MHLSAVEHQDKIVFLHHVEDGPASQSYGLQVAALAGVPGTVIRQARRYLAQLENQAASQHAQPDLFAARCCPSPSPGPTRCWGAWLSWISTRSARAKRWRCCMTCGSRRATRLAMAEICRYNTVSRRVRHHASPA